jgi:hypothetical protein
MDSLTESDKKSCQTPSTIKLKFLIHCIDKEVLLAADPQYHRKNLGILLPTDGAISENIHAMFGTINGLTFWFYNL